MYSVYGLYNVVTVVPHWCSVSKRQCRLGLISMEINFLQDVNFFFLPFYLFLTFTSPSNCAVYVLYNTCILYIIVCVHFVVRSAVYVLYNTCILYIIICVHFVV